MSDTTSQAIIDALITLATRDGMGDEVVWEDIEPAIYRLLEAPVSMSNLRRRMAQVNDPEVALTLTDWFERAAGSRDKDARDAARPSEMVLGPLQGVGYGGGVTAVVLTATGALPLAVGTVMGVSALIFAIGVTMGRLRLSKRTDYAVNDARNIRKMADITRKRGEKP